MKVEEKRIFWNHGEAKGYSRKQFFENVIALLEGEELTDKEMDLMLAGAEHELETILLTQERNRRIHKEPMESDYAIEIINNVLPLLTNTPMTSSEITELAKQSGLVSVKTGKPYAGPWIARVLNNCPEKVVKTSKIVNKTNAKGLVEQKEVVAYIAK